MNHFVHSKRPVRIIADALPVRFQLQMHKLIWSPDQRGV